jgi:signal transduction histidine kinase
MYWRIMTRLWQPRRSVQSRLAVQQAAMFGLLSMLLLCGSGKLMAQHRAFLLWLLVPAEMGILGMATWAFAGKALAPLRRIRKAAGEISIAELSQRLPVPATGDELEQLGAALNEMLSRLESSVQPMQEFLPNVSHELRRTLTALYADTERALRRSTSEEDCRRALSNQLQQVRLACSTISDLLMLAQTPAGNIEPSPQEESLSEVVRTAIDAMRGTAAGQEIEIVAAVEEDLRAEIDAGHLWRALLNLVDNAIKFNRPQGCVEVVLASHEDQAVISVRDTGCGIAPGEREHIFDRSYRTPGARKSRVHGSGLGLSFVRAIAEAYGGRIEVESTPGEGSCFRMWLPLLLPAVVPAEFAGFSGVRPTIN